MNYPAGLCARRVTCLWACAMTATASPPTVLGIASPECEQAGSICRELQILQRLGHHAQSAWRSPRYPTNTGCVSAFTGFRRSHSAPTLGTVKQRFAAPPQEVQSIMTNRLAFAQFRPVALRKGALAFCVALCTLGLGLSASAEGPTFTTFDPPGSFDTSPFRVHAKITTLCKSYFCH